MIVITDKTMLVNNVKTEVNRLLSKDDWMSIREFEGGEAMPDNVKAYRASIRDESNTKVAYINNCLDNDCLIAYQNKYSWNNQTYLQLNTELLPKPRSRYTTILSVSGMYPLIFIISLIAGQAWGALAMTTMTIYSILTLPICIIIGLKKK